MNILSIISVLIPSTLKVSWVFRPLLAMSLWIDGIIYSLVSYSYKLFLTMCRFNMAELLNFAEPLINRVKALVMVVIMFKIAISLIQYMLDPDKVSDGKVGGSALIKRVVIVIALLISYNFIFGILNDLSLLIIGAGDSNSMTYLESSGTDAGLISRLVFGSGTDAEGDVEKFGDALAVTTLQLFVQNVGTESYNEFFNDVKAGKKDLTGISVFSDDIGTTVQYRYPILSAAVGAYLIYCIVKVAIQVGVRMFKLLILQLIAPVAIICYIDTKQQNVTNAFVKAYTNTYVDVFIRVLAMFLATAFIGMASSSLDNMFGQISGSSDEWYTKVLLLVIIIIAAYRFVLQLPKLISEIFGYNISDEGSVSFGKALKGITRGAAALGGAVVGGAAGLIGGGGLRGFLSGAGAGFRGKTIADKVKGVQDGVEKARNKNREIQRAGGYGEYLRAKGERALGIPQRAEKKVQDYKDNNKLLDNINTARGNAVKSIGEESTGLLFGTDPNEFAKQFAEYDSAYNKAKAEYEANPTGAGKLKYELAYASALSAGKEKWNEAADGLSGTDKGIQQAVDDYRRFSTDTEGQKLLDTNEVATAKNIQKARESNDRKIKNVTSSDASRRANRAGLYGDNK